MSSVTPLIVTHPCALVRDGLRPILAKSPFRPVHILPALNEETESYLASAGACIWLVGVNECGPTTNDLVRRVVATNPSLRPVILTASHTPNDILPAFLAGACGFLGQDIPSKHLIKSLELIALGQSVMHPHFQQMVLTSLAGRESSEVAAQSELSADPTHHHSAVSAQACRLTEVRRRLSRAGERATDARQRRRQKPVASRAGDFAHAHRRRVEQDHRAQAGDHRVDGEGAYEGHSAEAEAAEQDSGRDLGTHASRRIAGKRRRLR